MHVLIQIDALQNSWLMGQILEINKNKKQCCLKCEIVNQQEKVKCHLTYLAATTK